MKPPLVTDELENIKTVLQNRYPDFSLKVTERNKIKENDMRKTIHIIKKKNKLERPFDSTKDGQHYINNKTNKKFPKIFKCDQKVSVHQCVGKLKCLNADCEIFLKDSVLNSRPFSKKQTKYC